MKLANATQQKSLSRWSVAIEVITFSASLLLSACGDDSTVENITQVNQSGIEVISDVSKLPKCTKENDGEMVWVKGEIAPRKCSDAKWYAVTEGSVAANCSTKELKDKNGVKIICGGDSIGVVLNGKDGSDGKDGKNGTDGKDGKNGTNGVNGADGSSCTAVALADNSGLKVLCNGDSVGVVLNGKKGSDGKNGADGASCTAVALADNSGLKVLCNGDSVGVVHNGKNGADGTNGTNGENGTDGVGCTMAKDGSVVSITCGDKLTTINIGEGGNIGGGEIAPLDSEKIVVSLDEVSGVTQKGPFLMGSKVLVREMEDGRTLTQTGNSFNGKILNDKGEFKINARMLVSQYVMLEATGYYRNEVTGQNSNSELTLFAITDVNGRNIVNINLLTHLEYERVIYLVTQKKMKVRAAKKQAQKEVFGLLNIDATDFSNSEDLNIAGASDEDGALLAFSLMFQGDRSVAELTTLLQTIANDMEKDGTWDDATTRMKIAEWSADADSAGRLAKIRDNVASWGLSSKVPNFEQFVRNFWYKEYGLDDCSAKKAGIVKAATAGKRKGSKTRYICKDASEESTAKDLRWMIASDLEKDTYGWKNSTDGALKNGDVTNKIYVFDSTGSFNGTKGWREAESIEKQYGGCRKDLFDSIRTDKVYAYYYTCKKSTHAWVREVDYLLIDTQYWPDSTDGKVKWGDSIGVATPGDRICYVWDDAKTHKGWRAGNVSDCNLGLLGCTAKRGGEMRKAKSGRYYSCSENSWVEITDEVYINTYLYRCTIDGKGDKIYKDGDLVYGIEMKTTRYACENEQWRGTKPGEEQAGKACTARMQGTILGDTITCDTLNWRTTIVYDYPVGKNWFNKDLDYGTLKDKRDGRTYKTIKIGKQVWMAENLAYSDSIQSPYLKGQSWCYNNDSLNCLKGGRYYSWTAAMDIHYKWLEASPYSVEGLISEPHQGICPDGWHIPNNNEWTKMYDAIGTTPYAMQAKGHRLWPDATNASGFTAIPVGRCYGCQYEFGSLASFVSVSEVNEKYADVWHLQMSVARFSTSYQADNSKKYAYSIRCVKNSASE